MYELQPSLVGQRRRRRGHLYSARIEVAHKDLHDAVESQRRFLVIAWAKPWLNPALPHDRNADLFVGVGLDCAASVADHPSAGNAPYLRIAGDRRNNRILVADPANSMIHSIVVGHECPIREGRMFA